MTVGALHLQQHPSCPSSVKAPPRNSREEIKSSPESPNNNGKHVSFFPQVRVHRRKIDTADDMQWSELWYTRSEYRAMKQDILAFRKVWRQHQEQQLQLRNGFRADSNVASSLSAASPLPEGNNAGQPETISFYNENEDCSRGVEQFLFPSYKKLRENRRNALLFILLDAKDSICGSSRRRSPTDISEDVSITCGDDSTSSSSSYETVADVLEEESQQAVHEALIRGDQDAKAAIAEYGATCAELQKIMSGPTSSSKPRTERRRVPRSSTRAATILPSKAALKSINNNNTPLVVRVRG